MIAPEHDDIICCTGVMSWPHSSSLDDIVTEDSVVDAVLIVEQNLFFKIFRVTVSQYVYNHCCVGVSLVSCLTRVSPQVSEIQ